VEPAQPAGRFPKAQRIRKRAEFRQVQAGAKRVVTDHFVMLLGRRSATEPVRLGITASRKVGNAVVRNRIKRLVREAFRACRELWPRGTDVVIIVRSLDRPLTLSDVIVEWRRASRKIAERLRLPQDGTV
jgi:ribonuclease P protein component